MSRQNIEGTPLDRFAENDAAEFTRHLEHQDVTSLDKAAMERVSAVNPWGITPKEELSLLDDGNDHQERDVRDVTGLDRAGFDRVAQATLHLEPTDQARVASWSTAPEEELSLLDDGEAHEDSVNAAADERTQFAQNLADATGGTVYHQGHVYEADPAGPPFDMPMAPAVPAPPAFDLFRPTLEAQQGMPPLFRGMTQPAPAPLVPIEFDSLADPGYSGLAWHYRGALRHDAANFTWHGSTASNLELRTLEAHLIEALVCLRAEMAERGMTSGRLVLGDG